MESTVPIFLPCLLGIRTKKFPRPIPLQYYSCLSMAAWELTLATMYLQRIWIRTDEWTWSSVARLVQERTNGGAILGRIP